ncbi:FG-GAP-like repeat-containing protein [Gloeobacter violaceus]|nr:FG-GAP-like repeat-containing protein [Gloeobacter violaceus]
MGLGLAATMALLPLPARAQVSFETPRFFAAGERPYSVAVGDLDGDGDLDLAVADEYSVSVLLGNGDGSFGSAVAFPVEPNSGGPRTVAAGDFDGDGDLDLVTSNGLFSADVSVVKNNGDGTFAAPILFAAGRGPFAVVVGDFDGDGDLDVATADSGGYPFPYYFSSVSVLDNNGNGTFAAADTISLSALPVFTVAYDIAAGDFDGDGDLDLVTANGSGYAVTVLKNNGNGRFRLQESFGTADSSSASVATGDLDGDGDLDLAVLAYYGEVAVALNTGDGSFGAPLGLPAGTGLQDVVLGDIDGDGQLDIVAASTSNTVSVLLNEGNALFAPASFFPAGNFPQSVATGDFDGDGDLDLTTANFYKSVAVLLNTTSNAAPTIAAISPRFGAVDSEVTLTGTGLGAATAVKFRSEQSRLVDAEFAVVSDSEIRAVVPAGAATGLIGITSPTGKAASPTRFRVLP